MNYKCLFSFFICILCFSCTTNKDGNSKKKVHIQEKKPIDSLLINKAIGLMESGKKAYNKRNLEVSKNDFFTADSILQSQHQWSLVVKNLTNTITLAEASKQSKDSISSLVAHTQKFVDSLSHDDINKGGFYLKQAWLANKDNLKVDNKFHAKNALEIFLKHPDNPKNALQILYTYQVLGHLEVDFSNFEEALVYFKKAIAVSERFNFLAAQSYSQLFYLNVLLKNDAEAYRLISYIDDNNILEGSYLFTSFDHYRDRAYFYLYNKEFENAFKMLRKQDELTKNSPYGFHFSNHYQDQLKSEIYTAMGEYEEAISIVNNIIVEDDTSLKAQKNVKGNSFLLAENYLYLGDEEKYMYYIQDAINFHVPPDSKNSSFFDKIDYSDAGSKDILLKRLHHKSTYCINQYNKTKEERYKTLALHTLEQQHNLISFLGETSKEDAFVTFFNYEKMYEDYLSLVYQDWVENPTKEIFYKAFTIADQSKNNVILGEIKKLQQERLFKNIPAAILEKEHSLSSSLDTLTIVSRNGEYSKQIDSVTVALDALKKTLKLNHPKYYEIRYGTDRSIATILQENFSEDNVLAFLIGDSNIFVFNQKKGKQIFNKIPFQEKEKNLVTSYLNAVQNLKNIENYKGLETALYN